MPDSRTDQLLCACPGFKRICCLGLAECCEKRDRTALFLARDGYFMYRIAQRYCEELCLPVECVYLCCSRYSLRIPTYHTDMEEALSYICRGGIDVTLQKILDRSGLTWEEQKNVRTQLELPHEFLEDPDAVIPYAKLGEIRRALQKCSYFLQCVEVHSKESMPALAGYLKQAGLLEEKRQRL